MEIRGKAKMLELTIYGLMGLTAVLVIAFFFAFGDEFPAVRETVLILANSNAHLNDPHLIEPGMRSLQFRDTVAKQ
jgi:hypothetical protein